GTVWCFGVANHLGNGATMGNVTTPQQVAGLTGVAQLTSGAEVTCVAFTSGGASCWGQNGVGQVGNGTLSPEQLTPSAVVGIDEPLLAIDGASYLYGQSVCAVTADTEI